MWVAHLHYVCTRFGYPLGELLEEKGAAARHRNHEERVESSSTLSQDLVYVGESGALWGRKRLVACGTSGMLPGAPCALRTFS